MGASQQIQTWRKAWKADRQEDTLSALMLLLQEIIVILTNLLLPVKGPVSENYG